MQPPRPASRPAPDAGPTGTGCPVYLADPGRAREVAGALRAAGLEVRGPLGEQELPGLPPLAGLEAGGAAADPCRDALRQLLEGRPELLPHFGEVLPGFDYLLRPSAYALLRDDSGRVAIARQPLGDFLVGGGIEAGESPEDAIRREGVEEVGLRLEVGQYLGSAEEFLLSPRYCKPFQKRCHFFRARIVGHAPAVEEDHELVWVEPARLVRTLFHTAHRWAVTLDELDLARGC